MSTRISRRNFVAGAAAATTAACAGTAALAQEAAETPAWDYETDVAIIGFGGAGAISAITAADAGAEVIVLEKQAQDTADTVNQTNSTRLSHSAMMNFSDEQGALDYLRAACFNATSEDVMAEFAKYMVQDAEWANGIGCHMYPTPETDNSEYPYDVFPEGENYVCYVSEGVGNGYWKDLEAAVFDRDITVLFESPATKLITDDSGAVIGVTATQDGKDINVKARRGVILACGGFEFNFDMLRQFMITTPCRFNGNPDNTGDGIKMAQEIGADLWRTSLIGGEPIGYIEENKHGISWYGTPNVWVDKYGRRFVGGPTSVNNYTPGTLPNHSASYACLKWDFNLCDFNAVPFYLIFDQSTVDSGGLLVIDWLAAVKGDYVWSNDLSFEVDKGWILKADTLEELGKKIAQDPDDAGKMDGAVLAQTIATFNQYCAEGEDPEFHTAITGLNPLLQPPYYAFKMYPGCWNTFGGPKRDPRGHILDVHGDVIPGLFGAGECGSVLGFLYAGGGWNIMEGVASGRLAGEEAAAQEPRA